MKFGTEVHHVHGLTDSILFIWVVHDVCPLRCERNVIPLVQIYKLKLKKNHNNIPLDVHHHPPASVITIVHVNIIEIAVVCAENIAKQ